MLTEPVLYSDNVREVTTKTYRIQVPIDTSINLDFEQLRSEYHKQIETAAREVRAMAIFNGFSEKTPVLVRKEKNTPYIMVSISEDEKVSSMAYNTEVFSNITYMDDFLKEQDTKK